MGRPGPQSPPNHGKLKDAFQPFEAREASGRALVGCAWCWLGSHQGLAGKGLSGGCGLCFGNGRVAAVTSAALTGAWLCAANGQLSSVLLQAYLPVVSYQVCSGLFYWGSVVKTTMVCAGGDGVRSGCQVQPRGLTSPPASPQYPRSSPCTLLLARRVTPEAPSTAR